MGACRVYTPVSHETDQCNRLGSQAPRVGLAVRNPERGATLRDGLYSRRGRMEGLAEVERMHHVGLDTDWSVHM